MGTVLEIISTKTKMFVTPDSHANQALQLNGWSTEFVSDFKHLGFTKLRLRVAAVPPVLPCGRETWPLRTEDIK